MGVRGYVAICQGSWASDSGRNLLKTSDDTVSIALGKLLAAEGFAVTAVSGVGTRAGWVGKVVGGAWGVGTADRLRDLQQNWAMNGTPGLNGSDLQLFVLGWSRGAVAAKALCNELEDRGCRRVDFLGMMDPVGGTFKSGNQWTPPKYLKDNRVSSIVKHSAVCLSADVKRRFFHCRRFDNANERWFGGAQYVAHSIGGAPGVRTPAYTWLCQELAKAGGPDFFRAVTRKRIRDVGLGDLLPSGSVDDKVDFIPATDCNHFTKQRHALVKPGDVIHKSVLTDEAGH